jgi:hypothetical protein
MYKDRESMGRWVAATADDQRTMRIHQLRSDTTLRLIPYSFGTLIQTQFFTIRLANAQCQRKFIAVDDALPRQVKRLKYHINSVHLEDKFVRSVTVILNV